MSELKIGIMTNKELAEWFGMSESYFLKKKKEKLEELKEYAEFEEVKRKIKINFITIKQYVKKETNYQKIKSKIDENWNPNGIDTKKHVAQKIYNKKITELTLDTTYSYVCKGATELYGRPDRTGPSGEIGLCHWTLCILDTETGEYRDYTAAEQKIEKEIYKKYFSQEVNKQLKQTEAALTLMLQRGKISQEEYDYKFSRLRKDRYINYNLDLEQAFYPNKLVWAIEKSLDIENAPSAF